METLQQRHQRDLNRVSDSDRNTRKRGLLKLLDEIPWGDDAQRPLLQDLILSHLLPSLLGTIADGVEKCRETTLQLLHKCLDSVTVPPPALNNLVLTLCARVNDAPFPEPTEELRLQVVLLVQRILASCVAGSAIEAGTVEAVAQSLVRALADTFPAAKQACAELVLLLARHPQALRAHWKRLLASLHANALHQHGKTRVATMRALGTVLRAGIDIEAAFKDPVQALLHLLAGDKSAAVRRELAAQIGSVLSERLAGMAAGAMSTEADLEMMVLLLLLLGDETAEVSEAARAALEGAGARWRGGQWRQLGFAEGAEVIDGEAEMQQQQRREQEQEQEQCGAMQVEEAEAAAPQVEVQSTQRLLLDHLLPLSTLLLTGANAWTVESRRRFLCGLDQFLQLVGPRCLPLLPSLLASLGPGCRDDEPVVRAVAERCCVRVGSLVPPLEALQLLLPRVDGLVPGGDTASARTSAIRVLTCLVRGFACPTGAAEDAPPPPPGSSPADCVQLVSASLARPDTYAFSEAFFREALLLLARALLAAFPAVCADPVVEADLSLCLLFLQGRTDGGELVAQAAAAELGRLAGLSAAGAGAGAGAAGEGQGGTGEQAVAALLGRHYPALLAAIAGGQGGHGGVWEPSSPSKQAFECLVRLSPRASWQHWALVLPLVERQVQPPATPATDTPEAHQASYAAQRGEETPLPGAEAGTRLALLALLEGWVRAGTADWECGQALAACAEAVIKRSVVPNLVWRVGRVESTVRKVALAVAYGLLRAGAAPAELLYKAAPELVPLLASSLDDSDTSVRHMGCLCLAVVFERLKGAFGPQAVGELYPVLVKRLDDSSDDVRVEACRVIGAFIAACGGSYAGTSLDYTLDLLFVHLDDPEARVQVCQMRPPFLPPLHLFIYLSDRSLFPSIAHHTLSRPKPLHPSGCRLRLHRRRGRRGPRPGAEEGAGLQGHSPLTRHVRPPGRRVELESNWGALIILFNSSFSPAEKEDHLVKSTIHRTLFCRGCAPTCTPNNQLAHRTKKIPRASCCRPLSLQDREQYRRMYSNT